MAISDLIEQTIAQHIIAPKVLSYAPSKLNEVTGRFVSANRVYNFVLNKDGVSYSPAGQNDSLLFSALYLRQDAVRKPKVGNDKCNAGKSYQCGKICLGNRRKCHKGVRDVNDARRIASILESTNRGLESKVAGGVSDKAIARGRALFEARGARLKNGKTERVKIEVKPESKKAKTNRAKLKSLSDIPNIPESAKPWVKAVEGIATPKLVAIAGKLGFPKVTTDAGNAGAFYTWLEEKIGMGSFDPDPSKKRDKNVFLHEYGHYIDFNLHGELRQEPFSSLPNGIKARKKDEKKLLDAMNFSQEPEIWSQLQILPNGSISDIQIKKALKSSVRLVDAKLNPFIEDPERIEKFENAKTALRSFIKNGVGTETHQRRQFRRTLMNIEFSNAEAESPLTPVKGLDDSIRGLVYDLFGAITKNKVGFGHSDSYYGNNDDDMSNWRQGTEAFANIIAIANSGDEKAIAVAKKFAPNMWKFVMDSIKV